LVYHNVTPWQFFEGFDENLKLLTKCGKEEIKLFLKSNLAFCIADSEFNKNELNELGFDNVYILPIIIDVEKYKRVKSNPKIKFDDGYKNFLFVGRIAPNKKIEDLIKIFFVYKNAINPKARLIIIGSFEENEYKKYYFMLQGLIKSLNLKDVIFTGRINFRDMVTIYRQADVFITMSEHEGFCLPLVEAMIFGIPIIAFNTTAIPETLGGSGILVNVKNYTEIAELIDIILMDHDFRDIIIKKQYERLSSFNVEMLREKFIEIIKPLIT
jgi:glycosyltransferase involved in cell wall biosynthesis